MSRFKLVADYAPTGDQPEAIEALVEGLKKGYQHQTLLGATGTGKTFVMANIVERINRPTLVIAHNKTLAAQLYSEFKSFFPNNAVEYFVSYYDYYQPEAYVPQHDLYIEKEATINEEIDRLRLAATAAVLSRRDVLIVASVSCIYGIGDPNTWGRSRLYVRRGEVTRRNNILRQLANIQYTRNDFELQRGTFRVRGDTMEIMPGYSNEVYRISMWGDEIERITAVDPLTGEVIDELEDLTIFPAKQFIAEDERLGEAIANIEEELAAQLKFLREQDRLLEAQRLEQRTLYDLEMLREVGYCAGIENYSRHLDGRAPGTPPWTLIDYFPDDFLLIIDESHMTIPQIRGMYHGDRSRKETLVEYGFRLPSALDNRPLRFDEFERLMPQTIFVSATPGPYELERCRGVVIDQVVRPTGLVDPEVEVRPVAAQVDDLLSEIRERVKAGERVLVTTLTKRMAEDLTEYLFEHGVKVRYLHSDIDTVERAEIIRDLRSGAFDVLVGINLLREGLDLPEVSLVAILDADKEGFLRSTRSLIQTIGRAARNINGKGILYADTVTESMRAAIEETQRRREKQLAYNREHGIVARGIVKEIKEIIDGVHPGRYPKAGEGRAPVQAAEDDAEYAGLAPSALSKLLNKLEKQMHKHARNLEFEQAAAIRDKIRKIRERNFGIASGGRR